GRPQGCGVKGGGIVDQGVHSPPVIDNRLRQGLDCVDTAQVGLKGGGAGGPGTIEFRRQGLGFRRRGTEVDGNIIAPLVQGAGDGHSSRKLRIVCSRLLSRASPMAAPCRPRSTNSLGEMVSSRINSCRSHWPWT